MPGEDEYGTLSIGYITGISGRAARPKKKHPIGFQVPTVKSKKPRAKPATRKKKR